MKRANVKLVRALAVAGVLSSLLASPVSADHDDDRWHGGHRGHYEKHRQHGGRYYSHGYYQPRYYYVPRPEYYAPPPVYVVPPPPSWGLNLVFPLHIH